MHHNNLAVAVLSCNSPISASTGLQQPLRDVDNDPAVGRRRHSSFDVLVTRSKGEEGYTEGQKKRYFIHRNTVIITLPIRHKIGI